MSQSASPGRAARLWTLCLCAAAPKPSHALLRGARIPIGDGDAPLVGGGVHRRHRAGHADDAGREGCDVSAASR
eukprot:1057271-Prymnesium_polylepis.1